MLYKNLKDLQHVETSSSAYTPFMPSHLLCYGPFVTSSESPQDNLIRHKLEHKWVSPHNLMTNKKSFTHFLYGNPSIPPGYSDSHHSHLSRQQKDYSWFIHMSKQMTTLDSFLLSDLKSLSQWPKSTFFPLNFPCAPPIPSAPWQSWIGISGIYFWKFTPSYLYEHLQYFKAEVHYWDYGDLGLGAFFWFCTCKIFW